MSATRRHWGYAEWLAAYLDRPETAFTEREALLFCAGQEQFHDWRISPRAPPVMGDLYFCTRCLVTMVRPYGSG